MQDAVKNKKSGKAHIHALIFLTIVCCIFLSATAGITYMILKSTDKELELQVERNLLSKAHEKVSELSAWYGSVTNQVKILSNSDFLRLFTYEATQNFSDYADMLELSKKQNVDDFFIQPPIQDEITVLNEGELYKVQPPLAVVDDKLKLAQQLISINENLEKFVKRSNFLSAYIYSTDLELFAGSNNTILELNKMQKDLMEKAMEQNSFAISSAYHASNMKLTVDIIQPIYTPAYITEGEPEIIGYLLISIDVTFAFNQTDINESAHSTPFEDSIRYWVIQQSDGELIKHDDNNERHIALTSEWKIIQNKIPFGTRTIENSEKYYSLGLDVPNLPWLVVADIPISVAKSILYSSTNLTLFISGSSILVLLLLITFSWWWLVGQEERKSKAKIIFLYETIEKQKTLLENVNSNLQDGIVMRNKEGIILYANDAFAKMMQANIETIIGSDFKNIFIGKTDMPVNPYINEVIRGGEPIKYNEKIRTSEEIHHFQVTYAPYRTKEGEIDGIVGIYIEITDLIRVQNSHQLMSLHLIKVLKRTIEAFDPYLRGHSTYTSQLAVILAYMLELNEKQVSVIKTAAYLSQIGMIQLSYELRSKTSVFTAEDRKLMETHISLAKNILEDIEFGLPVQNVIYQMFEKLDGTGYPKHLKAEDICIESRILSVANTFCAIMRPRAHRQAQGLEQALQILSPSNKSYDSNIIRQLHIWLSEPEGKSFVKRLESL